MTTPADRLREGAEKFDEVGRKYGHGYIRFGSIMKALFPEGLTIETQEDWIRVGLFQMIVHKVVRQADDLHSEDPDPDHARDLKVYAAMLESILHGDHVDERCLCIPTESGIDDTLCRRHGLTRQRDDGLNS